MHYKKLAEDLTASLKLSLPPMLASANRTLTAFHEWRREDLEAGQRPTVRESLARLSS